MIRNEDEPKKKIVRTFKFTDIQYEAIINMRIRNLAKLQEKNIVSESKSLKIDAKHISAILKSNIKLKKYSLKFFNCISTYKNRETSLNIAKIISAPTIKAPPVYIKFSVFSVNGLPLIASIPNNVS